MIKKQSIKAYVFISLAILLWSTVASAFKIGLKSYSVTELLFLANLCSVIVLFALLIVKYPVEIKAGFRYRYLFASALTGFINPFLYYIVLFKGYSLLPAQVAQPINYTWPILLSILAMVFLKQKLRLHSFVALIISFVGLVIVSSQGNGMNFKVADYKGVLYCLCSSFLWAFFWILNLKDARLAVVKLFYNFLFAQLYITILIIASGKFPSFSIHTIATPIYIGFFEMSITFYLWLRALEISGKTAKMSNLIYLVPVLSLVFIHYFLKEKIHLTSILGLLLILMGVLIQLLYKKQSTKV